LLVLRQVTATLLETVIAPAFELLRKRLALCYRCRAASVQGGFHSLQESQPVACILVHRSHQFREFSKRGQILLRH
jgi:hypothetical protein